MVFTAETTNYYLRDVKINHTSPYDAKFDQYLPTPTTYT